MHLQYTSVWINDLVCSCHLNNEKALSILLMTVVGTKSERWLKISRPLFVLLNCTGLGIFGLFPSSLPLLWLRTEECLHAN